jgi:hypothetical protein
VTEDLSFFVALESQVWEALRRGDGAADARLLAENFLGLYDSGFATRADHSGQLDKGPTVSWYELETPRLVRLGAAHALLAYEARWRDGKGNARRAYISSIWERRADGWRNVFSQDTGIPA